MGSRRGRHDLVTQQHQLETLACWWQWLIRPRSSGLWQYLFAESQRGHSYGKEDQGGREHTDIPGRRPREDGGRDWATSWVLRIAGSHWKLREKLGAGSRRGPPEGTLPTPWFLASGRLDCERVHFYCFKPPNLWLFVTAALAKHRGNQTRKRELSSFLDSLGNILRPVSVTGDLMTPIHGFSESWTQFSDWTTQVTTALSGVCCAIWCVLISYLFYAWYQ